MLDDQIASTFIGHNQEVETFTTWLDTDYQRRKNILFFHDATHIAQQKGGVGKTWLLHKCAALAQQKRPDLAVVIIDFFSINDRDNIEIARRIVERLQATNPSWNPADFRQALNDYYSALHNNTDLTDTQARLYKALISDIEKLDKSLPAGTTKLLLCFDTYELVEPHPSIAVLGSTQLFPDTYHFHHIGIVIAGRNKPDWEQPNWKGRKDEVQCIPIQPFNQQEMVDYINANCHTVKELHANQPEVQKLYLRTQGRPILVGLATDILNKHILTLEQLCATGNLNFEEHLVLQINKLENPINLVVLFMAHIYHRFNPDLLAWLFTYQLGIQNQVGNFSSKKLFGELGELTFVRLSSSGEDVALHDEMRRLVLTYNWKVQEEGEPGKLRRDLSFGAIGYYENENQKLTTSEKMRQTNIVELLYHKLYVDRDSGFLFFEEHFKKAINQWQQAFARSLLQEVKKYEDRLSQEQKYSLLQNEALLLAQEEDHSGAIALLQHLENLARENSANWLTNERLADLLFEKGNSYLEMSRFEEAITCLNKCLEINEQGENKSRQAMILVRLGYIYRRQGELDKAADYYQQGLELYKERKNRRGYAEVLHSIGILTRIQGKFEEALRQTSAALRIRQELLAQGFTSEIAVALSLGSIGTTYLKLGELIQAQRYFQEAFDIYERNRYRKGMAMMYNRFGQVAMEKSDNDTALSWFKKAFVEAVGIDAEAEINSLNKQGRVLMAQKSFEEAIPYFTRAIERANEIHDYYQRAESLIDLAAAYERLEQYAPARKALFETETITARYRYFYLLGQVENLRGDHWYKEKDYLTAFGHYGQYCYNMARYNATEYERAVRKTTSILLALNVSKQEVLDIQERLKRYWLSLNFTENPSLMLQALEEVHLLLDV